MGAQASPSPGLTLQEEGPRSADERLAKGPIPLMGRPGSERFVGFEEKQILVKEVPGVPGSELQLGLAMAPPPCSEKEGVCR